MMALPSALGHLGGDLRQIEVEADGIDVGKNRAGPDAAPGADGREEREGAG
ncbi:MAG: hypothetical protein U0793_26775 [Gemmataceae bacterium]